MNASRQNELLLCVCVHRVYQLLLQYGNQYNKRAVPIPPANMADVARKE